MSKEIRLGDVERVQVTFNGSHVQGEIRVLNGQAVPYLKMVQDLVNKEIKNLKGLVRSMNNWAGGDEEALRHPAYVTACKNLAKHRELRDDLKTSKKIILGN